MKKNIAILVDEEIEHPKDYRYYCVSEIDDLNSKYENIYIGDLLDYLPQNQIQEIVNKISDKLEDNGQIHIKSPDILQMCWYCAKFNLDLSKFRYIIYQTGRKFCYTLDEIVLLFSKIDKMKVETASYINAYEYSITVTKHESN